MRRKAGKWYADWRDEHGRRHMKAFPTKKQALAHANKQRRIAATKKARASGPSATSAVRRPRPNTPISTKSKSTSRG
jgi:hypothetical protein